MFIMSIETMKPEWRIDSTIMEVGYKTFSKTANIIMENLVKKNIRSIEVDTVTELITSVS